MFVRLGALTCAQGKTSQSQHCALVILYGESGRTKLDGQLKSKLRLIFFYYVNSFNSKMLTKI